MNFSEALTKAAIAYGIELSPIQIEQFTIYYDLLIEWNQKMNLTAIMAPEDAAVKHMIDSLTAYDPAWFKLQMSLIDVGTGAGFPGLPLKLFQPDIELTLLDSLNKRVKFLQAVVDELGLTGVTCIHGRAEEAARDKKLREKFDIAASRAVAQLPVLLEYTLPFVKPGGFLVALKGLKYQEETSAAAKAIKVLGGGEPVVVPKKLPGLDDVRACIYVKKIKETPKGYPRKAGTPEKVPIL